MAYALHLRKSRADIEAELRGEGESLARHRRRLLELAARLGLPIACEYRELVSGDKLSDRPEMRRLLADVAAGRYEGVLTVEVSRLTRGDLSDQGLIVNTFKYSGTKIVTPEHTYDLREDWDEDVIAGDMMLARREYRFIKRRLQRGRNASAAEGLWQGPAPFGYRRVKLRQKGWTLEPEPAEAALARMAFELYASGREGGAAIARRLNALGSRTARGNPWTADAVACLVSNPVYAGKVRWNARVSVTRMEGGGLRVRREKNPAPLVSDGRHPALVPQALFDAAQRVRAERALPRRHADAPLQNPLAGLVFCAACGRAMTRRAHGERAFLRCPRPGCRTRSAPLARVENAAVAALARFALFPNPNDSDDADGAPVGTPSAADAARAAVARLRAQLERIFAAFEDGAYTAEEFAQRREEKRRAIERAEAALRELERPAPAPGKPPPISNAAGAYALAASPEQKNRLLKAAFARIEYSRDDADNDATLTFFPWFPVD